ncbi:hypothetical protein MTO96_001378 [Rhipicephalus appendiculatus]
MCRPCPEWRSPPWAWKTDGARRSPRVPDEWTPPRWRPRAGGDRATVRQAPPCSFAYASLRMPVTRCCDRPLRPASTARGCGSRKEGHAVVPPSIIIVGAPDAYTPFYSIYLRLYLKVYLLAQSQQEERALPGESAPVPAVRRRFRRSALAPVVY